MNCSSSATVRNSSHVSDNIGASVFMATYIGFYGMGIIVYYTYQFMTDSRDGCDDDDSASDFFRTFHQINQRQKIYDQLTNQKWIKDMYTVYYSDQLSKREDIEEKANQCAQKYHEKMLTLRSRQTYYATELSFQPTPTIV